MLKRDESIHRLLPDVQAIWASGQRCDLGVLAKITNRPLTRLKLWTGWRLAPEESLARLAHLATNAFIAETQGKWIQADFYWREISRSFRRMPPEHAAWQAAATVGCTAAQAYEAFADELMLDTHIAFYNSYEAATDLQERRHHSHLSYVEELMDIRSFSLVAKDRMLGGALKQRIIDCKEAKQLNEAARYAQRVLEKFPNLVWGQELYASVQITRATDGMEKAAPSSRITSLSKGISTLEQARKTYPLCASIYEALGHLYHIRAIQHANATAPSDAMLDIEKALVYAPGMDEALEAKAQISDLMRGLQRHVAELFAKIAGMPNARLTAEGENMKRQASRGFQPAEQWVQSEEAASVRRQLSLADAATLWDRIGLDRPESTWPAITLELVDALNDFLAQRPSTSEELESEWGKVIISHPALAVANQARLFTFLNQRLFGQAESPAEVPERPAALLPIRTRKCRSLEPLAYWLLSRENPITKLHLTAAVLAIVVVISVASHRWLLDHREVAALQLMRTAHAKGSTLDELQTCETYLWTLRARGRTTPQAVREQCDTAFVRWFAQLPADLDSEAMEHVQRYKSVSSSIKGADGL